uniref:Uncharacterized protein n=1 Tax=Wuchereria bancrofti TaxID=6293 RepID=A0A1I8ESE4_WUCBA
MQHIPSNQNPKINQKPLLGFITVIAMCFTSAFANGMFHGFDILVWILISMNSAGGLLISIVIKYADNIAKTYAQSASILGATFGSWILFNFTPPSLLYCLGGIAIIISIIIYNSYPFENQQTIKLNS